MRVPMNNARAARSPLRPRPPGRVSQGESLPAPVGGWDAVSPLASMPKDRAIVLDNWFPQPGYIEVRKGYASHATGMPSSVVDSLLVYNGLTTASDKMFAVCGGGVYDVSAAGAVGAAAISGLSSNRWQSVNFTTSSGNHYLWMCSGADSARHYNGSVWATPAITGITSSDIVHVNVHKNRLWFCLVDSMKAAYLPTDSVAGAATLFYLGSVMQKGGYLVSMGTWTHDAGGGPDDYAVFLSSRGQAAVYMGTDPASSETWQLVGVYDMGAPLGRRSLTKIAGDLALIGIDGVLPFSVARSQDRGAAAAVAITANINRAMNTAAQNYGANFGWELTPYPKGTRAILNVPISEGSLQHQYVMNTLTGAWCRFTGWNANCFAVYKDNLYFGSNAGVVNRADTGGKDGTAAIDAVGQGAYSYFKSHGRLKQFKMIQPLLTVDQDTVPSIGLSTDFKDNAVLGTPQAVATASALWDSAVWDVDSWPVEQRNLSDWTAANGIGQCASIHFRAATQVTGEAIVQLNGFNVIYETGEFL
jgi:hypothetical protein